MSLTDDQFKTINERAMPLLARQIMESAKEGLDTANAELQAAIDDMNAKEAAFKDPKTGGKDAQREAFLAAQVETHGKKVVADSLQSKMERLGNPAGMLEAMLKGHWDDLCPGCRESAGKPPLEEKVEADEIAQMEADIAKNKALIAEQEAALAERKAG